MSQALEQGQYEKDSNLTKKKLVLNLSRFFTRHYGGQKSAGNSKLLLFSSKRSCSYIVIALGDRVGLIAKLTLHFWLVEGQNLQFHKFQNLSARATLRDNLQLRH